MDNSPTKFTPVSLEDFNHDPLKDHDIRGIMESWNGKFHDFDFNKDFNIFPYICYFFQYLLLFCTIFVTFYPLPPPKST